MNIVNGRLSGARQLESPNCDDRPDCEISLIVIHNISLPEGHFGTPYIEQLFCNELRCEAHPDFRDLENIQVSSHLLVKRDGAILQFVPFDKRAWHAGISIYRGREHCNDYSIGIELEGTDYMEYADIQYAVLADICQALTTTYEISITDITGHCDIAPDRKTDPGPYFSWERLYNLVGLVDQR
ncbi:MAG: 1,6-anhydro-N-acetylmuramyl-L-alanine amidase AmpD [Pseudomonadales bacterium]